MTYLNAIKFAAEAHKGQVRKFTGLPYITHPLAVMDLARLFNGTHEQILAGLLHDTVEDTDVTLQEIKDVFGPKVEDLVWSMTKPAKYDLLADVEFYRRAPREYQFVRLCDIVDNTKDVRELDPRYAATYLPKKRLIVAAMESNWKDNALWLRAMAQTA